MELAEVSALAEWLNECCLSMENKRGLPGRPVDSFITVLVNERVTVKSCCPVSLMVIPMLGGNKAAGDCWHVDVPTNGAGGL
jgi:hypothetical protein